MLNIIIIQLFLVMYGNVDVSFESSYYKISKNEPTSNEKSMRNDLEFLHILNRNSEIIAFSPDDKGGIFYKWNISDGKRSTLVYLGERTWIAYMAISHNEDFMIIATLDNDPTLLKCFSISEKKWLWEIRNLDHYKWLGFSPDDKEIIAFGNNAIYRIDTQKGALISSLESVHNEYPLDMHKSTGTFISPSGKYLIIWQTQGAWALLDLFRRSANKNISVWDITTCKKIASMQLPKEGVRTATFTSDEKNVFLGCGDKTIKLWSLEENKIIKEVPGIARDLVTSNKQNFLASGIEEEDRLAKVKIWRYPEMTLIHTIEPFSKSYFNTGRMPINFDETGKYFGVERDGKLYLYDTSNWEVLWSVETSDE